MAGDLPKEQKDKEEEEEKEIKKKKKVHSRRSGEDEKHWGRKISYKGGRSSTRAEDLLLGREISYHT